MATQRDLEEINRQYPSGPDAPRIDEAIGFIRAHTWGNGKDEKPQIAWPERDFYESDESYIISMLKQLFVELAELRTLVAKQMTPIYHLDAPEIMDAVKRQEDMGFP